MADGTDAEKIVWRAFLKEHMTSDLLFALSESGVPLRHQHALANAGFVNMRLMTGLDETRGGVRTALNAELRLDPATTVNYRLVMATLVSAW